MATRISLTSRMMLVFVRSRPARNTGAAASAAAELPMGLRVAFDRGEDAGDGGLAGRGHRLLVVAGGLVVGGQPHPVDGGQRSSGFGLPGRRARLPLVGATRAELVQEVVEGLEERPDLGVVGRAAQALLAARRRLHRTPSVSDVDART